MSAVENNNAVVLFDELNCANGTRIGVATLNAPKTLNGLSLDMTRLLATQIEVWAKDPAIALLILKGAGDKAFCAGGDLHALHHSMVSNLGKAAIDNTHAGTFFAEEYALDYRLHTFPKPIVVWGDGIVMGGGMGLMMGASHRVVTETSRLAMPEISIGLFPDVGGTWMLNRLPGKTGLFLGLTGAQIGAADALFAGMADYHLTRDTWPLLLEQLTQQAWYANAAHANGQNDVQADDQSGVQANGQNDVHANGQNDVQAAGKNEALLDEVLARLTTDPAVAMGPLQQHLSLIHACCVGSDLNKIVAALIALTEHSDPWLQRAAKTLGAGSPGSARLTYTLLKRVKHLSLADAYRFEWVAGLMCASHGDFAEGIRALLIDKDKQPKWNPATLNEATEAWVEKFFTLPFPAEQHPLYRLGLNN
jgi:enoyl-CoA hydratase/carnithine racemase